MDSLKLRNISLILLISLCFTAISVAFQAYLYIKAGQQDRNQTLTSIQESYLEPTASAVFYLDWQQLELISKGIAQLPFIEGVRVMENIQGDYQVLLELDQPEGDYQTTDFPLTHIYEGEERRVGRLVVQSSLNRLMDDLPAKLRQGALFNLILVLALSTGIWLIVIRIKKLQYYDALTGLPNRRLFEQRLGQFIGSDREGKSFGAILLVDVDQFRSLNDSRGHSIGDLLLREIGTRIRSIDSKNSTVYRVGGDEFAILLENLNDQAESSLSDINRLAGAVEAALEPPFVVDSEAVNITASIGVATFDAQQASVGTVLNEADIAMLSAKQGSGSKTRFYDPEIHSQVRDRMVLETDLKSALGLQQLEVFYQPQVDTDGITCGAEVLLRWQHPTRGMVSPAEFIPLAEESDLIQSIGRWVMESACKQLFVWSGMKGCSNLTLAVNVSSREFSQPDFVDSVKEIFEETGADPSLLKIELTESMVLEDISATREKMQALQEIGVGFAIDDFGTGFSSLMYLTSLPLETLKIDRAFVRHLPHNKREVIVTQGIIGLAKGLKLNLIAEGVETEQQRAFLLSNGCERFQGFYFSPPLPLAEFEKYFSR
ncbi:putative bifunctional diguanylate cyclase/phosphodiesterase [Wenzhouxiangella limi]|uniref:cyclic-guanylate-specific phosphodiesterase n=1 Tax=Wenzhouxiangella limi TaxID=2707351 RepID=A0A845V246_9GAMM|nr:EAL domain-containing protein [Wenzhouxiangella limi]NDY96784.1 EAL domain-containing protein [Wenzhouxiangella limi]